MYWTCGKGGPERNCRKKNLKQILRQKYKKIRPASSLNPLVLNPAVDVFGPVPKAAVDGSDPGPKAAVDGFDPGLQSGRRRI